ncbi:hypothetical protein JM946_25315 [Steroidobacter sp. S1-65]|uniref:Uncharacterized protein n=1 Tax=Steroidobacter gossypii TaxID=2805490 RepID=A0ABS1X4B8_9GAMM|nr:hypothetical protein [Steroidobacter gossypii]MBM0108065.1 hypothetical protein [Steroidobacter gossypii]
MIGASRLALLIAAAGLAAGAAQAAEIFRAHYEISVATNGTDSTVRSTFETRPGEAFTLDLPPNQVAMEVRRLAGENYELQVTVKPAKQPQARPLLSRTYQGILGRPLELSTVADAVQVEGAISVVVLNR